MGEKLLLVFLLVLLKLLGTAESCSCSSTLCNCYNQSLTSVPQDLPTHITNLDLGINLLTTLSQSDFSRYRSLEDLYLDRNSISTINSQAFYYLSNVTIMWFNDNRVAILRADMFTGLENLRSLILFSNDISDIQAGTFSPTPRLISLSLQSNKLTHLRSDMFTGLGNLQTLYLYDNGISNIQPGTFDPTPHLKSLYLNHNHIASIPSNLLGNLLQLDSLQLSNNNITSFPFEGLSKIQTIGTLYLDNNQMTTLPSVAYDILSSIFLVRIQDNPWQCDCRMFDFRLKMTGIYSFEYQVNCSQPDQLYGQMLKDINPQNLMSDCEQPTIEKFGRDDNMLLVQGETLILVCEASGIPTPDITVTLPSGLNATVESVGRVTVGLDGVITIAEATTADTGLYVCIAANPLGSKFASLYVQDLFYKEPTILSFKRSDLVLMKTLRLVCETFGNPTPDITVILPSGLNATVESGGRVTVDVNGTITVRNTTAADAGLYVCTAENTAGSTFATLFVDLPTTGLRPSMTAIIFSLPVLIGAVCGSIAGTLLIVVTIAAVWRKRKNKTSKGPDFSVVYKNTNTATTAL